MKLYLKQRPYGMQKRRRAEKCKLGIKWLALVNMIMTLWVSQKAMYFLKAVLQ